jgi:MYXO-CTERM domain-containing protein
MRRPVVAGAAVIALSMFAPATAFATVPDDDVEIATVDDDDDDGGDAGLWGLLGLLGLAGLAGLKRRRDDTSSTRLPTQPATTQGATSHTQP